MLVICTNFSNCSLMCTKVDRIPSFNSPEETETFLKTCPSYSITSGCHTGFEVEGEISNQTILLKKR